LKITLSLIKADVGSIGGHTKPSKEMMEKVKQHLSEQEVLIDYKVWHTGDDIVLLMSHQQGKDSDKVHKIAYDAFVAAANIAKEQGLYGAGQDLLSDSFSGNVKGMGPGVAEIEFEERANEPFVAVSADKTDPGAYNLPLYLAFADPMHNSGLMLAPSMAKGFRFTIMDVSHTDKDRVIELDTPEGMYDIAALLRDNQRFVVESIHSRETGEQAVEVSTTRLHNIAGKYTGKDDPVYLARVQGDFPATGEVISPYAICHYVAGFMRGSHTGPMMPVKVNSEVSFFDGPPIVSAQAFCVKNGKITDGCDLFAHPFWDTVRQKASEKAIAIREQGFSGAAMLPYSELEYGGIVKKMEKLHGKFKLREK